MTNDKVVKKSNKRPIEDNWFDAELADDFLDEFGTDLDADLPDYLDNSYANELCKGIAGYDFADFSNNW